MNKEEILKYIEWRISEIEREFDLVKNGKEHFEYSKQDRLICLIGAINISNIMLKDIRNDDVKLPKKLI